MEIETWTPGKITCFEFCPVRFYLENSYEVKPRLSMREFFHIKIHHVLSLFWKNKFESPESFANYWRWYWPKAVEEEGGCDKFRNPERAKYMAGAYRKKGAEILKKFYENNIRKKEEERLIDRPMQKLDACFMGFKIRAKIDEICRMEDGVHLIDYSMTKKDPGVVENYLKDDPVVVMNSMVFRSNYEGERESKAGKNILRLGETVLAEITEEDHERMAERIRKINEKVKAESFEPRFDEACGHCKYLDAHYTAIAEDRPYLSKYNPKEDQCFIFQQASS